MRRPRTLALLTALAGAGVATAWTLQEPTFEVHPVAGTVSMLVGDGGNIGLCLTDDGLIVVDDQLARQRETVVGMIASVTPEPPRFLLNTHHHGDHVGNNEPFGELRVPIVSHAAVRRRLAADSATPRVALPSVTYEESLWLHLGDERVEVRHFGPGHTDGDSVAFFHTSKVVHMGDLFFHGRFPFIDLGSGGTPEGYAASVAAVVESIDPSWKVIPGHGPLASYDDLRAFHAALEDCIAKVRGALEAGKTVEDMITEGLLADYEEWSWRFISTERFLGDLAAALAD